MTEMLTSGFASCGERQDLIEAAVGHAVDFNAWASLAAGTWLTPAKTVRLICAAVEPAIEAMDFDGDAIMHPDMLSRLEEIRDRIAVMAVEVQGDGRTPIELPDTPDADFLEMLRARFVG